MEQTIIALKLKFKNKNGIQPTKVIHVILPGVIYAKNDGNGNPQLFRLMLFLGSVNVSHLHSRPLNNIRGKKERKYIPKSFFRLENIFDPSKNE